MRASLIAPKVRRARVTAPNELVADDIARMLRRRGYSAGDFAVGSTYRRDGLTFEWSESTDDCPVCFKTWRYCRCGG